MRAKRDAYGLWGTTLWALAAVALAALATFAALTVYGVARRPNPLELSKLPEDYFVTLNFVVIIAVLITAARTTRRPLTEHFGFIRPSNVYVIIASIGAIVLSLTERELMSVFGDAEASFQAALKGYQLAQRDGLLPLFCCNAVALAPLSQEMMFRGFLLPSWAKSKLGGIGAILATSILFAVVHVQYDWPAMIAIGLGGLFCAWLRLRSGSLIPPLITHISVNMLAVVALSFA